LNRATLPVLNVVLFAILEKNNNTGSDQPSAIGDTGREVTIVYKKILAPLDSSKLSELSLEHVKKVALATDGPEVVFLIVLEPVSFLTYASTRLGEDEARNLEKKSRVHAQKYVNRIAARLKKEGINAQGEVVWGRPADEILQYIEKHKIDLVIMSTHGRSGIPRWAMGSVADKVIRSSPIPVLIIPPQGFRNEEPAPRKKRKTA
jgi:nucleotide-binding universal stress UspA family protein